jgi:hypothetical protein
MRRAIQALVYDGVDVDDDNDDDGYMDDASPPQRKRAAAVQPTARQGPLLIDLTNGAAEEYDMTLRLEEVRGLCVTRLS